MPRSSAALAIFSCSAASMLAMAVPALAEEPVQSGHRGNRPLYQRRAFERSHPHGNWHGRGHRNGHVWSPPRVAESWFQRPYPYHLDYYRMRYGGSYAPYFGNLYGPPQVVTAPPYYGPYYGDSGFANGPVYAPGFMNPEQPASANGLEQDDASQPAQDALPAPMQP